MGYVSLAEAKQWLNVTGADDDALITRLIDAASDRLDRMTDRHFALREYAERINGDGEEVIQLRQWPVTEVLSLSFGRREAIRVSYTGSGIRAVVSVLEDRVRIRTTDTAGVVATVSFAFEDHGTTELIAAEIDAETGWNAEATLNVPSVRLNHMPGADARLGVALFAAEDQDIGDYTVDLKKGTIGLTRPLELRPEIWSPPVFDDRPSKRVGFQNIVVEYEAGFDPIPDDIKQIVLEIVKFAWESRNLNTSLQSENLDQYSYTLADRVKLDEGLLDRISHWRRLR